MKLRHLIIKFITPIVWKASPKRKREAIVEFSLIEKDSAVQLLECMKYVQNYEIKADLFQHVLEEFNHADLFEELAKKESQSHLNLQVNTKENVLDDKSTYEDFVNFYSYVHVGESEVNEDFYIYSKVVKNKDAGRIFEKVASDEKRHTVGTDDILVKLCEGDTKKAKWLEIKSNLKRHYKLFVNLMSKVGQLIFNFYMLILYFMAGVFLKKNSNKQFEWSKEDHLKFLDDQIISARVKK